MGPYGTEEETEQEVESETEHMLTAKGGERGNGGMGEKPSPPTKLRKGDQKMTEREFDLATRAVNQDMELRRDAGGCYWLDSSSDPNFRSIGPMSLDEVEARIEAAEGGISRDQFEETQETQALVDYQETGVCCLCGKRYEHW